jgi:VWFA-related protein
LLPVVVMVSLGAIWSVGAVGQSSQVRITSPQGRLGGYGAIRIVARATAAPGTRVAKVTFFVGDEPVGEDTDGPVYAVEWTDDNPFEVVTIRAQATDDAGGVVEDRVTLPAMDVTDETSVASVLLDVAVLDKGRHVSGLTREHFALREDATVQTIELVEPSRMPTVVTLLVDTSQSMSSRFDFVRRATRRLSSLLRPDDQLAVVPFSRSLGPLTGPTRDLDALTSAIDGLSARGGTAIADALDSLAGRLADAEGRQIVVLITDGYDEHSRRGIEDAVATVRRVNATLYSVGIGGVAGMSFRGRELLKRISEQTGGRAFFPSRDAEIPLVQEHIYDDVVHRYLLTYTPTDQTRNGRWRAITLRTGTPEHVVKTRDGYFAPAPIPVRPSIEFTIANASPEGVVVGKEDLEAIEDGVAQAIDTFHEAVAPVSILLALDESGSMRKASDDVKAAARRFVDAVRDEDRLGVVMFSDAATLATDLTLSRVVPRMTIDAYTSRGGTALYDAVRLGLDRLGAVEGRRVVVVLTDGRDENGPGTGPGSRSTLDELLERLRDVDAAVFTIGLGPNVDVATLERMARASGGQAYFPATVDELPAQYARVIEDLRRRYVLSYTSTNGERDGRWRQVDLRVRQPGMAISSRGGYRAPGS